MATPAGQPMVINAKTVKLFAKPDTQEHPACCDICHSKLEETFVDGATRSGRWANMCLKCFTRCGVGIGVGCGQIYDRVGFSWLKR